MPACLRFTMFPPGGPPMTFAAPEDSFRDSIGDTNMPSDELFVVKAPFTSEADDMPTIAMEAARIAAERRETEGNMAIMYYWTIGQFVNVSERGTVAQKDPSPLTVDELRYVHDAIAQHPAYVQQRLLSLASDGTPVDYPPTGVQT